MTASTNTLITPSVIAKEALMQLENNLVMGSLVHRDYSKEFNKVGSTVSIRKPVKFKSSTGATRVSSDVVEGTVPISIDTQRHVSWDFVSKDLTLTVDDYSERYIKPAMIELAQQVELSLMSLYSQVPAWTGTAGTTPSTFLELGAARQILVEHAAPMGDTLNAVLNPSASLKVANDLKTLFVQQKTQTALERVKIGKYAGFDTYESASIVNHTVGALGGTPLVAGASQNSNSTPQANSMTLNTDGWTASTTGVMKAGDVITIAGVYDVNPKTYQTLGYLKQFVVLADADSGASTGPAALTIAPAIVTSGPYQNVTAGPADNAAITVVTGTAATSYPQNLCFHKNAFALVMADLDLPDGAAFKARQSANNLSARVVKQYDIDLDRDIIRLDILYGVKCIYPELAVRLTG
jgi:FlaG/FlaF family flagellin (archaellin)